MTINRRTALITGGAAATGATLVATEANAQTRVHWQHEADVVVVGAGASGVVAALKAREAGLKVILVEAESHAGGHAICSGGNMPLGGGTSFQKKWNVKDSPDLVFQDLTDWSVTSANGSADYRYNDREVIRAFADNSAPTCEFLIANGVVFVDKAPDTLGGNSVGASVPREMHCAPMDWTLIQTGKPAPEAERKTTSSGNGLMHPLIASAKQKGVEFLMGHKLTGVHRPGGKKGPVVGVAAEANGKPVNIRARRAVVLATGGSTSNVNFRRMFDPRLTDEYCGVAGEPWSKQSAAGELAAMDVGGSLWGLYNNTGEFGSGVTKPGAIGTQYGYVNLRWYPGSEVWDKARATGLQVKDWQNVITVNMLGNRFYDETGRQFSSDNYGVNKDYTPNSWRNAANIKWSPNNWLNAAMAGVGDGRNGGGPIWAIFDADAVAREKWDPAPPNVDPANGFFFKADTIGELARKIQMKYQYKPMPPENLEKTVARYNGFVDKGADDDFAKPKPAFKIAKAPFYAAWCTPVLHDTRAGLRINAKCQVVDMNGEVIPALYTCGETAGGFSLHGIARATCQGFIAGTNAAKEGAKA